MMRVSAALFVVGIRVAPFALQLLPIHNLWHSDVRQNLFSHIYTNISLFLLWYGGTYTIKYGWWWYGGTVTIKYGWWWYGTVTIKYGWWYTTNAKVSAMVSWYGRYSRYHTNQT